MVLRCRLRVLFNDLAHFYGHRRSLLPISYDWRNNFRSRGRGFEPVASAKHSKRLRSVWQVTFLRCNREFTTLIRLDTKFRTISGPRFARGRLCFLSSRQPMFCQFELANPRAFRVPIPTAALNSCSLSPLRCFRRRMIDSVPVAVASPGMRREWRSNQRIAVRLLPVR